MGGPQNHLTGPIAQKKSAERSASLTNADISELLATEADSASQPLQKAFRRAARKAFLWTDEASELYEQRRSLTELPGIGPYLEKIVRRWLDRPPLVPDPPDLRRNFLTWTQAHVILQNAPLWSQQVKGDLQMHSVWSDGSGSIQEMAEAGEALGYEYIAITDHAKGLKIAGGIDEEQLAQQALEIEHVNDAMAAAGHRLRVTSFPGTESQPGRRRTYDGRVAGPAGCGAGLFSFRAAEKRGPNGALRCRAPKSSNSDSGPPAGKNL
jgi:hypothetical protein